MRGEIVKSFSLDRSTVFELVNFFDPEEIFIEGREMIRRAAELDAMLGIDYARRLLNHSDRIPKSCDEYDIVFAGALICLRVLDRRLDNNEYVAYIRNIRGRWLLGYGCIEFDWDLRALLIGLPPPF